MFGSMLGLVVSPAWAETNLEFTSTQKSNDYFTVAIEAKNDEKTPHLSEIDRPATTVKQWLSQGIIQVTSVKLNPTEKGVEVILETTNADKLQPVNRSEGNNFIADIPNAQLRLTSGESFIFRSEKPINGITEITVTNFNANTVRITATSEVGLPGVDLFESSQGLIFSLIPAITATQPPPQPEAPQQELPASETPQEKPSAQQDDLIELVVTGQQDGYRVPNASVGTRTDTPLLDIPQSIQVVP
jgi:iron complex outermembrane receptor protein